MKRIILWVVALMLSLSMCRTADASIETHPKLVALTFDDGPGQYTEQLLDGLKERDVKATFFMLGVNALARSDTVKRMKEEGHQLGAHTMNHVRLTTLTEQQVKTEIQSAQDALSLISGEDSFYLRPPYGSYGETVQQAANVPLILWDVDPEDWKTRDAQKICEHIVANAADGDIILLHDIYETSVQAALAVIDRMQADGYTFLTVEQLLKRRGIEPEAGKVYRYAKYQGVDISSADEPVIALKRTLTGVRAIIGKTASDEAVYYAAGGASAQRGDVCSFYLQEGQAVQAIAVNRMDISAIGIGMQNPELSRAELDRFFYRYAVPFLRDNRKFQIGVNVR